MNKSPGILYLGLGCVFLIGAAYFFSWPVSGGGDTDFWYHLSGGRYFFLNNKIPDHGFFSFIAQNRTWSNYYWLFQVIVSLIYSLSGYYGIIFFRSIFYLLTIFIVARLFLSKQKNHLLILYFIILSILFLYGLIPRYFALVRPHIFSYLFIVLFLYILEKRPDLTLLLPLLSVLWCNIHGIEYPVMMLICLCFLVEIFCLRLKNRKPLKGKELLSILSIVAAMWMVLVNPHGLELLKAPFVCAEFQPQYTVELRPVALSDLFQFSLFPVDKAFASISNILLLVGLAGALKGLLKKNIRISHLLLFIGGAVLLAKASRFRYEAVLLAVPLLKAQPLLPALCVEKNIPRIEQYLISILLVIASFFFFNNVFAQRAKYPFSPACKPEGTAVFLNKIGVGGTVMNIPSHGGYLQWRLDDNYRIFMDMETILFTDTDYFVALNTFKDRVVLGKVMERYHPDFITPLNIHKEFRKNIEDFPEYVVVFFDDMGAVYMNKEKYPEIAARYELMAIDPFYLADLDFNRLDDKEVATVYAELGRIYEIYPDGRRINELLALICRRLGMYDKVFFHCEMIIKNYPESPLGYGLKGEQLVLTGSYNEAVKYFKEALARTKKSKRGDLYRRIRHSAFRLGDKEKAYDAMSKAVDIFSPSAAYCDLYELGVLALEQGKIREGGMLLEFAALKCPPDDKTMLKEIQSQFLKIENR